MRIRVPETLAGITADWLEEALASRFPGVGIAHVEPVDVLHGACTKIRLAVRGDHPDLPPTMLMKAGFEPHSPAMRKMHVNEYHAYHDLMPTAGLNVPDRSEEHTSELQSLMRISYAVFCLKKKT